MQEAARTLERRATTVNILDMMPPPAAGPPAPPLPPGARAAVDCADEGRCTVARGEFERLMENPAELMRQARVLPSIKDGERRGLKLYAIRGGSFPATLGFKNGDLLTAINGLEMRDPEAAHKVYSALRRADTLVFSIERKGEPVTLSLEIE
jgi:general secretion pathway protein C